LNPARRNNHMNELKKLNSKCTSWASSVVFELQREMIRGNEKDRWGKHCDASKCWRPDQMGNN
jgi:hypothetical protein